MILERLKDAKHTYVWTLSDIATYVKTALGSDSLEASEINKVEFLVE